MLNVLVTEELRTDKVYRGEIQPPQETIGGENINDVIVKFIDSETQKRIERVLQPNLYSTFREAQRIPAYSFFPANGVILEQGGIQLGIDLGERQQAMIMSNEGEKTENVIPRLNFKQRVELIRDSLELTKLLYDNQVIHDDLGTHNTVLAKDANGAYRLKQSLIDFNEIRTHTSQADLEKSSIDFALILIGGILSNTEIGTQKYHPNIVDLINGSLGIIESINEEVSDWNQQDIILNLLEDLMKGAEIMTPDGNFSIYELAVVNAIIPEQIQIEMMNTIYQYLERISNKDSLSFDTFYNEMSDHIENLGFRNP